MTEPAHRVEAAEREDPVNGVIELAFATIRLAIDHGGDQAEAVIRLRLENMFPGEQRALPVSTVDVKERAMQLGFVMGAIQMLRRYKLKEDEHALVGRARDFVSAEIKALGMHREAQEAVR